MAPLADNTTHVGGSRLAELAEFKKPPAYNVNAISPMVFCASFWPCAHESQQEAPICKMPNTKWSSPIRPLKSMSRCFNKKTDTAERTNANSGEIIIARATVVSEDHRITSRPPIPIPAPTKEPINACDEELGIPYFQVSKFQKIEEIIAAMDTLSPVGNSVEITGRLSSITVLATVFATRFCRNNAGKKLKMAASKTAGNGGRDLLAIVVAVELAAS